MRKLTNLLITLPLLALPLSAQFGVARAGELSATEGLQILAMANVADQRCKFLSSREHRELAGYEARAAAAAVNFMSAKARTAAIAAGVAEGKSAKCNDSTGSDVRETLQAARMAVAEADGQSAGAGSAAAAEPQQDMTPVANSGPVSPSKYKALVKPYFVDLKCHQLGGREARSYYRAIKGLQAATVAKYGAGAVSSAQAAARSEAADASCGAKSLAMAKAGLAAILGR